MTRHAPPRIHLVGIGPGSPELLSLRAAEVIRRADAIRHPAGTDPAILGLARPAAAIAPFSSDDEVVELARAGQRVAVLLFGDPLIMGDARPLAERLHRERLPFEVVPGLLTEAAGAAFVGIPLDTVGRSGDAEATRAFRVAAGAMRATVAELLAAGEPPDRAAAVIFHPGGPGQRKVVAPLHHLAGAAAAGVHGDALLVIGPGVEATNRLDTLAQRPLHGRRVLVTRARHQAEEFGRHLSELGAWVVDIPTIEVRPTGRTEQLERALSGLAQTRYVVFASANAVDIFFDQLFEAGLDARSLSASRVVAIGPETARSLEAHGIRPERTAGEYTAEGLVEAIGDWDLAGARLLVPRARENRDALPALLAKRGAEVEILPVYELAAPAGLRGQLRRLLSEDGVDVVTFTSSATVVNFAQALGRERAGLHFKVACMGPVTADTARRCGMAVDIIAEEYTTRGLALAIAAHLNP